MKLSTVLLILVPVLAISVDGSANYGLMSEVVPGTLRAIVTTTTYPEHACDGTLTAACVSCTQYKVCISSDPNLDTANPREDCPANIPYCSMAASATGSVCQKSLDTTVAECTMGTVNYKCTGYGFYPDAYTCQQYYYCAGPGSTPEVYTCPDGYKFSSKAGACTIQFGTCPTFSCKADNPNSIYQALPSDTQFYVFCEYDRTQTPPKLMDTIVFSCGQGATYNPTTDRCVYGCTKDGTFAKTSSSRQYYQCYVSGGRFVVKDLTCAADQTFEPTMKRCITQTDVVP